MSNRTAVFRGAAVLTGSQIVGQLCAFGRNIVIARMLSPHDVGIAAILAITWSLVEFLSDVSIDKLLIQAKDGDSPRLQAACQAALVCRGLIQAGILVAFSWPMARFFELPHAVWAFQCVAIAPLARGFTHLDLIRLQRDLKFMPSSLAELIPQLAGFAVIIPLAARLNDYRAVLFAMLLQSILYLALSHLLASRPYRWAWDTPTFKRILKFGWPLMLNGLLLFAIGQGDQIAIGAAYSKADLALWANAMLLASAPLLVLGKVAGSIALPILSASQENELAFARRFELLVETIAWFAGMFAVPLILGGGTITAMIFGQHYAAAGSIVGILAVSQAFRACRLAINTGAMAHGETTNPAIANSARLLGVALAVVFASRGASLTYIAIASVIGEVAAFVAGAWRLHQQKISGARRSTSTMLPFSIMLGLALAVRHYCAVTADSSTLLLAISGLVLGPTLLFMPYRRLRHEGGNLFRLGRKPVLSTSSLPG